MIVKDCERGDDRCIQGELAFNNINKTDLTLFKTCASEHECKIYEKDGDQVPTCVDRQRRGDSVNCRVTCCEDEKCNAAVRGQMVSVLLLALCVQTAFRVWKLYS